MTSQPLVDSVLLDEHLRALLAGRIFADGTRFGSENGHRAAVRAPSRSRRRCGCGCGGRATHTGLGDGVALMMSCEEYVDRWILDPRAARTATQRRGRVTSSRRRPMMSKPRVWNPGDSPVLPPADPEGYPPDAIELDAALED